MKRICVFCGSNLGNHPDYTVIARQLGEILALNQIELIYGGANVGLMRITAEEALKNKGKVTGVITHFLAEKHLTLPGLSELILVDTMHERKAKMAELADGFIALPGGYGTLEELFEILTAAQLGFHHKPVAIINIHGYYDFMKLQIEKMVDEKLLLAPHSGIAQFVNTPAEALNAMQNYTAPIVGKWIEDIRRDNGHTIEN